MFLRTYGRSAKTKIINKPKVAKTNWSVDNYFSGTPTIDIKEYCMASMNYCRNFIAAIYWCGYTFMVRTSGFIWGSSRPAPPPWQIGIAPLEIIKLFWLKTYNLDRRVNSDSA